MPGGFPVSIELCNAIETGTSSGTGPGVTITASGSTNTKGSWTQVIASTSSDVCWVLVQAIWLSTPVTNASIDIGVGAAASEVAIVNNLMINAMDGGNLYLDYSFPLQIPSGTRVSARCQSITASSQIDLSIITFDGSFSQIEGASGVDAIGFNTGTTLGTTVTPPGSGTAKGSYAQLTASTSRDYCGFFVCIDDQNAAIASFALQWLDIAIGGAGNEVVILPNMSVTESSSQGVLAVAGDHFIPLPIPSGTRIAARMSCASGTPTAIGVVLMGVYQ